MLRYHADDSANCLLTLIGTLPGRPTARLDTWVLRQCWLRRGLRAPALERALSLLVRDGLLTSSAQHPALTARGYGVVVDEFALPELAETPPPSLPPAAREHDLRARMLGFWMGTPTAGRPADQLSRAWIAVGESRHLFRQALGICLRSGHLARRRRAQFEATDDGRQWLLGRNTPAGLDTLVPTTPGDALPDGLALDDGTLCRLALGAFRRRPARTRIPAARLTHHLWRVGVPDALWLRALDAVHRYGHVDIDVAGQDAVLTHAGHRFAAQAGTLRARIRYVQAVRQLRPRQDTPHERF